MKATLRFIGGFMDGETMDMNPPLPHRLELWPVTPGQVEKCLATAHLCTVRDSQIYVADTDPLVFRPEEK